MPLPPTQPISLIPQAQNIFQNVLWVCPVGPSRVPFHGWGKPRPECWLSSNLAFTGLQIADLPAGLLLSNSQAGSGHTGLLLVTPPTSALRLISSCVRQGCLHRGGLFLGGVQAPIRWQTLLFSLTRLPRGYGDELPLRHRGFWSHKVWWWKNQTRNHKTPDP